MTTLVFIGNDFKYEMENVAKLFFPLAHFHFVYDEAPPESDYILFKREQGEECVSLSVQVELPAWSGKSDKAFPFTDMPDDNACEAELARQLFTLLHEMTGLRPQWGILTGVRPVKLVQKRLAAGLDDGAIRAERKEKNFVTDHKLDLALKIAHVQENVLKNLEPRDYSLYLSIPYCPSRCSYCSFVSHAVTGKKAQELLPKYLMALIKELRVTAELAERQGLRLRSI